VQFAVVFGHAQQGLVGIDDLFEIDAAGGDVREEGRGVEILVQPAGRRLVERAVGVDAGEDAAGESRRASARN